MFTLMLINYKCEMSNQHVNKYRLQFILSTLSIVTIKVPRTNVEYALVFVFRHKSYKKKIDIIAYIAVF